MQGQAQSDPHVPLLRIFVNSLQQPLRIFVEPGEVTNRPKLVRTIKNGGGVLCEAVSDANIVLVSPDTTSADQLIESWAGEKVFLDTVWVYESSRRGAAYLDNEGWGGYTVGNGDGTAIQNHLPTPRQTPSESKASSDDSAMQSQVPQPPTQPMHAGPSALPLFPSTVQQGTIPNGQFSMMPLSYMIHNPGLSSVDPVQYLQMATMQQQQGTNPLQMPVAQYLAMLGLYSQQGPPLVPQVGPAQQGSFPVPQPFAQQMMLPPQQPMAVDPLGYSGRPHDSASPGSSAQGGQTGSISDSRRSSMVQDGSHGPKRKKEQLTDPTGFSKKNKKDKVKDEGSTHYRDGSHSEDLQYASASSTGHPQHGSIVKDAKQFFVKGSGQPYRFFVQLQIISPKRGSIVAAIKKHGGVIESDIAIADFVILAHPKTTLFAEYFRQSCNMGKTPVKPQWVLKCDEKDRVVELDAYTYDGYKLEKKRGRPGSAGQQYVVKQVQSESEEEVGPEDQGAEEEENEETRPPKRPKKNAKEIKSEKKHSKTDKRASNVEKKGNEKTVRERATTSAVKAKDTVKIKAQRSLSPKGHREPSPLPPTDVVEFKSGKNLYTTAEEDYCDKYIPILLERDPAMTTSLIAEKLHAKMPHHPKGSWMSHLTQPTRRDKLERYRRRAEVQSRKARSASTWDPTKVLAEFFAAGRADSLQDSDVWKSLAEEHPQMRAEAWESLWQTEYENVQQEIARLGGPEASENAQAEPQ